MVYYVRREKIPKLTFLMVLMFFFAQSYISWVAVKREQYRALSIYINGQQAGWTHLRQIIEGDLNSTSNNTQDGLSKSSRRHEQTARMASMTKAMTHTSAIQTQSAYGKQNPGGANNLNDTLNEADSLRIGPSIDGGSKYPHILVEVRDMIKRANFEDTNTFKYEVKPLDSGHVNTVSVGNDENRTKSLEVVLKLKNLEYNGNGPEISPTIKHEDSHSRNLMETPDELASLAHNINGVEIRDESSNSTLEEPDGQTIHKVHDGQSTDKQHKEAIIPANNTNLDHNMEDVMDDGVQSPPCPLIPPNLVGRLDIKDGILPIDLESWPIEAGGKWRPKDCTARDRVAIIIPYRERQDHLKTLLNHLHPILHRQNLDYAIFVVELALPTTFNRGLLMNIGFREARFEKDYDCFIFHDVDLLPEDDRNLYTCPDADRPRHMSVAVSSLKYKLPYPTIFGGVSALTREQFTTVNGFSNLFFGWGGEDDDFSYRLRYNGYQISRYASEIARYTMLMHDEESKNPNRMKLLNWSMELPCKEGLDTLDYVLLQKHRRPLYTWLYVQVDETQMKRSTRLGVLTRNYVRR